MEFALTVGGLLSFLITQRESPEARQARVSGERYFIAKGPSNGDMIPMNEQRKYDEVAVEAYMARIAGSGRSNAHSSNLGVKTVIGADGYPTIKHGFFSGTGVTENGSQCKRSL